jgi:hypothetical protein
MYLSTAAGGGTSRDGAPKKPTCGVLVGRGLTRGAYHVRIGRNAMEGFNMLRKLLGLAGVGALLAMVLACGFGGDGDDDDDDDGEDFARGVAVVSVR